jgi:hypothetical protein
MTKEKNLADHLLENWAHWYIQSSSPAPSIAKMDYGVIGGIYDAESEQDKRASRVAVIVSDAMFLDRLLDSWDKGSNETKMRAIVIRHRYSKGYGLEASECKSSIQSMTRHNLSIESINRLTADARAVITARYQTR